MGMEIAEIILDVEDAFGVTVQGNATIHTVGDLCDHVSSQLANTDGKTCISSVFFWRLQHGISDVFSCERKELRPSTLLEPLIPIKSRQRQWKQLELACGLELPPLTKSGVVTSSIFILSLLSGAIAFFVFNNSWWPGLTTWICGLFLGHHVTEGLRKHMPVYCTTLGDLVHRMIGVNAYRLKDFPHSRTTVQSIVTDIIAARLALPRQRVQLSSDLVKDLGAG